MAAPVSPVTYRFIVNGRLISEQPLDVELRQEFGMHELFFVRIEYPRVQANQAAIPIWPQNAPVQILWGRGAANSNVWYGYVNHHHVKSNADSGSKALQVTYTCIGTSKPMNSDATRTWGQTSPTYMAKQIAAEHHLRAVLTKTSWVSDYEVQNSESDFVFLNRMAAKYGFRFSVSGGSLYFIDPAVVLAGSTGQGVPIYSLNKSFAALDTVRDFEVIEGDNIPGSELATRAISGVDQNTGATFTVTANGTTGRNYTKLQTNYVARSVAEAQVMADAWQNQTQFYIQGRAELFGNTLLYPGKLVFLQGTAMPANTAGYWMVSAADHVLKASQTTYTVLDKFVTRVRLIRNQPGSLGQPAIKKIDVIKPEFVPVTLSNGGVWQATNLGVIYDGVIS
jgi:phage protein D